MIFEPGRSIVAEAGLTLYEVRFVKDILGIRKYVCVDGGMTDNPRHALYNAQYDVAIANKMNEVKSEKVTIAGKCCESGDVISKDVYLQSPITKDILAVFCTGAYNYSMASNYNRIPRPPVVMVENGKSYLIVDRETYEDLIKNDKIPQHFCF